MSENLATLTFRPMDEQAARVVCSWRYEPPYDLYNINAPPESLGEVVAFLTDPANAYYAIEGPAGLEAFCCFGLDAQVPGGIYHEPAVDLGLGVRPDLTGQGRGLSYAQAVCTYALTLYAPERLRVTVAAFNQRAQNVWQRAGFQLAHTFADSRDGRPFCIFIRTI